VCVLNPDVIEASGSPKRRYAPSKSASAAGERRQRYRNRAEMIPLMAEWL
jgi:hypothetical protein